MIKIRFIGFYFLICMISGNTPLIAQNEQAFSQFYASSLYLNPAMSGLEHRLAISGIHRSQWLGVNPFQTSSFSVIVPYHDKGENAYHKGGFGANFYNARSGNGGLITNGFSLNGAYNLHIAATTAQNLTFGLQVGLIQKQNGGVEQNWGSQYDINAANGFNSALTGEPTVAVAPKILPEISAGLLYYYNAGRNIYAPGISFYLGFAVSHLNRANESVIDGQTSRIPILFKLHSGLEIHVAKMLNFSPNVLFLVQEKNQYLATGGSFTYLLADHDEHIKPTRIAFGATYRFNQAIVFSVGFGSKTYNLGLSYDWYVLSALNSALTPVSNAFEISFKTSLHVGKKAKKSTKFHTPLM